MVNVSNSMLTGKMVINGNRYAQNFGLQQNQSKASSHDQLLGSMRIAGRSLQEIESEKVAQQLAAELPELANANNADNALEQEAKKGIIDSFANEILTRCKTTKKGDQTAATMLSDSLVATAEEIKAKFGQEKANEFMSRILTATDGGVIENDLVAATSGFFKDLASEAMTKPELLGKLNSMKDFLNRGLEFSPAANPDQDQAEAENTASLGLSAALNQYFGQKALVAEDGQSLETKGFDIDFDRVAMRVARQTADGGEGGENWITLNNPNKVKPAEVAVDESTWQTVAEHLRTTVGNEKAAALFESGSGDFFGAVAASVAVVAQENGQEAAYGFVKYLNENAAKGLESYGFSFQGWSLGRDYSQPEGPTAGPPLTPKEGGFWFGDPGMDDKLRDKQHQGLLTNWKYTDADSGASAIKVDEVDLNEIYAQHQGGSTTGTKTLNNPTGNLVDTIT